MFVAYWIGVVVIFAYATHVFRELMFVAYWIGVVVIFAYATHVFREPDKKTCYALKDWPFSLFALALLMAITWPITLPAAIILWWLMQ